MKKVFLFSITFLFVFTIVLPALAATSIEMIKNVPNVGDYVVGPGKEELLVDPGQTITREIKVTNRFGKDKKFQIVLEDFQGSKDGKTPLELLGLTRGPYSLRDYIKPEVMEFKLQHGDRITIPVKITIPKDAVPGGLYGALIVSTKDDPNDPEIDPGKSQNSINIESRIAILYFIRVKGPANEDGRLKDFSSSHHFYLKGPIDMTYVFENSGNVYLDPKGFIEIKNMYGSMVGRIDIPPYYVLPNALRINNVSFDKGLMMGRYTAKITLDQGYLDKKASPDTKTIAFWVIPWKIILGFIVGLIIILAIIRGIILWFKKNFQRRKQ